MPTAFYDPGRETPMTREGIRTWGRVQLFAYRARHDRNWRGPLGLPIEDCRAEFLRGRFISTGGRIFLLAAFGDADAHPWGTFAKRESEFLIPLERVRPIA
ncbi:MAG: hypothetical protein LBK95_16350 [Bifidobacteriaceae bacterium]|nr:hypothetical protein [Bifidobacteriaceae bacterium]